MCVAEQRKLCRFSLLKRAHRLLSIQVSVWLFISIMNTSSPCQSHDKGNSRPLLNINPPPTPLSVSQRHSRLCGLTRDISNPQGGTLYSFPIGVLVLMTWWHCQCGMSSQLYIWVMTQRSVVVEYRASFFRVKRHLHDLCSFLGWRSLVSVEVVMLEDVKDMLRVGFLMTISSVVYFFRLNWFVTFSIHFVCICNVQGWVGMR